LQLKCACGGNANSTGECEECRKENEASPQRSAAEPKPEAVPHIVHEVLRTAGQGLDPATRLFMESRFGHDFRNVRVHNDRQANASARAMNALAYTVGHNVVFAKSQYAPSGRVGQTLLAHELAHVVQQSGDQPRLDSLQVDTSGEQEAETAAMNIAAGGRAVSVRSSSPTRLQRQEPIPLPQEMVPVDIPFDLPEFEEPEIEIGELPGAEEAPEIGEIETPEPAPETTPEPAPGTSQEAAPQPEPVPPVAPQPGEPEEKEKDRDACASGRLPPTFVAFSPGPLGQAGNVLASPLTRCPGNTRGSLADPSVYPKQFKCIKDQGMGRFWIPAHLLHGETRRRPTRNLHGPGNEKRNIIIAHTAVNRQMNASVEEPALTRAYDLNQVLWYESKVDSYVPGDEFFAHFSPAGCWFKGFAHEFPLSPYRDGGSKQIWPGVLDEVPAEFAACLREPAFSIEDVTFCIWRQHTDQSWQTGPVQFPPGHSDPDGSEFLLSALDGRPETYQAWAADYFGRDVPLAAVQHIYRSAPLSVEIVEQLNPDLSLADLATDVNEIGYPVADLASP